AGAVFGQPAEPRSLPGAVSRAGDPQALRGDLPGAAASAVPAAASVAHGARRAVLPDARRRGRTQQRDAHRGAGAPWRVLALRAVSRQWQEAPAAAAHGFAGCRHLWRSLLSAPAGARPARAGRLFAAAETAGARAG